MKSRKRICLCDIKEALASQDTSVAANKLYGMLLLAWYRD